MGTIQSCTAVSKLVESVPSAFVYADVGGLVGVNMALLAVMVSSSVTAASRVYRMSVFTSESQTLSSTINTALSDLLHYAMYVKTDDAGDLIFTNSAYGVNSYGQFVLSGGDRGYICYIPYENAPSTTWKPLVGSKAYTSLYVTGLTARYDSGVFQISYTICSASLEGAQKQVSCSFRSLTEELKQS